MEQPAAFYDRLFEAEGAYDLPYRRSPYRPLWRATLAELQRLGSRQVLEVGCGSGSFAQMLLEQAPEIGYRGFDFSPVAVAKARERSPHAAFFAADAREEGPYCWPHDTIVATEVLEHIEADLEVIRRWEAGTRCVCSVPNFDYEGHVRHFRHEDEIPARYGELIAIERIQRIAKPVILSYGWRGWLRQLRWSRDRPARFLGLLGCNTFESIAGWFLFSGARRG